MTDTKNHREFYLREIDTDSDGVLLVAFRSKLTKLSDIRVVEYAALEAERAKVVELVEALKESQGFVVTHAMQNHNKLAYKFADSIHELIKKYGGQE